jgi:hypothetical protein
MLLEKVKLIWFFIYSASVICSRILRGDEWHFILTSVDCGVDADGYMVRRQWSAKRTPTGAKLESVLLPRGPKVKTDAC